MVDIRLPFSMPSTTTSSQYMLDASLPSLSQVGNINQAWGKDASTRTHTVRGSGQNGRCQHSKRSAVRTRHGLKTPPEDMTGNNANPLLAPFDGLHYKSVPVVGPIRSSYQSNQGSHTSTRYSGKPQPFYDSYQSAQRPQSPVSKGESIGLREQPTRRRASSDGNSIVSYLQIPPSINNSKGSLAEFAAQVIPPSRFCHSRVNTEQITCLFWFESSFTLHFVEESKTTPVPMTPLVPEALPSMGFRKWVTTILSTTQVTQNVILLALMFIYRLKRLNPGVKGKVGSEFRLLTVALMLGNKFLDDNTYTNKTWAEVSGISVQEIHIMEVEFLSNMRYTLYASEAEWNAWHIKLGKFWSYFDRASKTSPEAATRLLGPPTSTLISPPHLPSPPSSTHTSPPFSTNQSFNNSTSPHPLSMPPYFPPSVPSPIAPMSESLKNHARKRSREDSGSELPVKRVATSLAPPAGSGTILTPSNLNRVTPMMPRLPMPNLSISTGNQNGSYNGSSPAPLPLPTGRAMSMAFPGNNRWPQNGMLPSIPTPASSGHHSITTSLTPTNERSNRQPNHVGASATPSPTSYSFPQPSHTPNHLSPLSFPATRTSPYKPVRGVNTLLVPPPSASMHNPSLNLGYDQMQYQPLGKPISERRAGVLPYVHHDTWTPPQYQMPPYLPQPKFPL